MEAALKDQSPSRIMRNKLRFLTYLGLTICSTFLASCSKTTEAKTRQEQEEMFLALFGFKPPKTVTDIKYKDVYNRELLDGAWGRWMTFTYDATVFSRILKEEGYKQRDELGFLSFDSEAAPKWWPNVDQTKVTIFCRSRDSSTQSTSFNFSEYIWHDTNSHRVYFFKKYWN